MRSVSRLITLALLVGVAIGVGIYVSGKVGHRGVGQRFETYALFRDASRLPVGSRVMIAGVQVGEIDGLAVEGGLARVSMRLRDDVVLYDDAWAEKRTQSLFGDGYVEVDPGHDGPGRRRLASGEPIPRVVEAASTDTVLRDLDRGIPRAQATLGDAHAWLRGARRTVAGPVAAWLSEVDREVASADVPGALADADRAVGDLERDLAGAEAAVAGVAPRVHRAIDGAARDLDQAAADLRDGRAAMAEALGGARTRLDDVDGYVADAAEVVARLDGQASPEDQGTLGRLINDPSTGDAIADGVEGVRDATSTLSRLETVIGLRVELNLFAAQLRSYIGAEVAGRHDSFYVIEAEKGALGAVPEVTLTEVPGTGTFVRRAVIRERLRFTAQYGKRWGSHAVRAGLKEGGVGIGVDRRLLGGRLRLSLDVFDGSLSDLPRVKLAAGLELFRSLHVVAGLDDALTSPGYLPIDPGGDDVPIWFEELRYGRDVYLGLSLTFDDEDVTTLLALYGALLAGVL